MSLVPVKQNFSKFQKPLLWAHAELEDERHVHFG